MIRDYITHPLKTIQNGSIRTKEKPYKEDIIELYIDQNKSTKQLAEYFKLGVSTILKILSEYNIKKDPKLQYQRRKDSMIQNYGYENNFQNIKAKEKSKSTQLEKYGCLYQQTNEYKEKVKQTKLERYGDENYNNAPKMKETNLEKYGVENNTQKNYTSEQIKVLEDKDLMESFIKDNNISNIVDLQSFVGVSYKTLQRRIAQWDLYHLFDYSSSLAEKEIREYVNQYYETENNTKKYLDGKEIDIFIPSKNIGIEFNGNYYHNEFAKDKKYHQQKSMIAESNGLFIYHIFEYEWNTKRRQILNQLNNLLGINQVKIYARKCIIKEVDSESKGKFLIDNHMQGNDTSSIKLGLYYNNELVSLMTFVKPRFNKKYEWELSRFCSKAGTNVIGGASKLFKYFVNSYKPNNIISYSNMAHTKGGLYKLLGFDLEDISDPNYVWIKGNDVKTRYKCQKHRLIEMGFDGDSEVDIMHNLGYTRIFDCGNKVWIWNKKEV